ncbi:GAF domain-containing protein [Streptomyces venezuelae]|uniref:GAF domain-containing protein n=1 Tax=Streptomyces venezuelae TaxID=54571 RepID=UPI0034273778
MNLPPDPLLSRPAPREVTPVKPHTQAGAEAELQLWRSDELPPPPAPNPHQQSEWLRTLNLHEGDPELDAFAERLAREADAPYAMVNMFGVVQHFLGLYAPPEDGDLPAVGRTMPLDHGYCPTVVSTGKSLALWDVYASPQYAGNIVVDLINIRAYYGAPLIINGQVLGSLCFLDLEKRPLATARSLQNLVKREAAAVGSHLDRRAALHA